jgi:hypothetical protein
MGGLHVRPCSMAAASMVWLHYCEGTQGASPLGYGKAVLTEAVTLSILRPIESAERQKQVHQAAAAPAAF